MAATISDVVTGTSDAVFAADDRALVVAWNQAAERGLGLPQAQVLGLPCYQVVRAVDADTGRPCYEQCPLVNKSLTAGWVHSRVLRAKWRGGRTANLDCMLVKYVLPSNERGSLSFVTPLGPDNAENYLRTMSALEALQPLATRSADITNVLRQVVDAVLRATQADVAQLLLLDPDSTQPYERIVRGTHPSGNILPAEPNMSELLDLIGASGAALVTYEEAGSVDASGPAMRWKVTVPLFVGGDLLGILTVTSARPTFSLAFSARALFTVAAELSVYLHWNLTSEPGTSQLATAEGTADPKLRCFCFGQFRVVVGGSQLMPEKFKRRKSLALLKILVAHRGQPLHREALMELLWPDTSLELASNNLRVVLHDLRHTLEPDLPGGQSSAYILNRGDLVYFDPSKRSWTDVEEFETLAKKFENLCARGRSEEALSAGQAAIALYSTGYMEDDPYQDWCIEERERLREVYLNLLRQMASVCIESSKIDEALAICRSALAADAVREETHRQLMTLLSRSGRRDEALRQYERLRNILWEELGVTPGEATERVRREILAAAS